MPISSLMKQLSLCALLVLCAYEGLARPFNDRIERSDVNPFPSSVPTYPSNGNNPKPCIDSSEEEYENGTFVRIVNKCCVGYTGENCTERETTGTTQVEFDRDDPCKGLVCEGVTEAQCSTVLKCGERLPVFLDRDGTIAECTNGQPVNVSRLTCTGRCTKDPCKGKTCSAFPNAVCIHTVCNCKDPMWLLPDDGVQVDCDTGEILSPDEAKRRRRRKREIESQPSEPPCA